MAGIENWKITKKISQDAKTAIESEDSAPEVDKDYLSYDEEFVSNQTNIDKLDKKFKNSFLSVGTGDESLAVTQWPTGQCF